ncbi:MAG: type I-B CRISPR-associated protein Cas8b/Csh1, partial [Candidatus Hodarchaeales archaeon]
MIGAIKSIGFYEVRGNLDVDSFLRGISKEVQTSIYNKKKPDEPLKAHVVVLDFDLSSERIHLDLQEVKHDGKDSSEELCWVGNATGNSAKIYVTSDTFSNVLDSILELESRVKGELKIKLSRIIEEFYKKKEFKTRKKKEKLVSKFFINLKKFEFNEGDIQTLTKLESTIISEEKEKKFKTHLKKLYTGIEGQIAKGLSISTKQIVLYSIKINGQLLCNEQEYREIVYKEKILELFDKNGRSKNYFSENGTCHVCGKEDTPTTSDSTGLRFKIYSRDKIGFSSNLDGKFIKNYSICQDCYQFLIIGEKFINRHLSTRIGEPVYIIPRMIIEDTSLTISDFAQYVNKSTNSLLRIKNIEEFRKELSNYLKFERMKNSFVFNYMFYKADKSSFKVLKIIKDVPPARLDKMRNIMWELNNIKRKKFPLIKKYEISLMSIWGAIPLKIDSKTKKTLGASKFIDIIDSLLSDHPLNYSFIINQMTRAIRIVKFEQKGTNIWKESDSKFNSHFAYKIIQMNFLIEFFLKMSILRGLKVNNRTTTKIDIFEENLPKEIVSFWRDLEIYQDDCKKILFLLGYLIGEIANAQKSSELTKKPILNKINFQGMSTEKL